MPSSRGDWATDYIALGIVRRARFKSFAAACKFAGAFYSVYGVKR